MKFAYLLLKFSKIFSLLWPTDDSTSNLTTIDIRTAHKIQETNIPIPSFPNTAYEAFVKLITQHKLSL